MCGFSSKKIFNHGTATKIIACALLLVTIIFISCRKEFPNHPPVANAGPDQTINLPVNSVTLDGNSSTDPDNNIASYSWTKVSGPLSSTIVNANAVQTQVTGLVQVAYQFELKVTDAAGLFSKDTVQVTVNSVPDDALSIISGTAVLSSFGSLSQAKFVVPATAVDKLVFAGGYSDWVPTATVDIYNLSANAWSTAQISEKRGRLTVATVGNKILYAGGTTNNGRFSSRVDIYDAAANTWSTAELSMARSQMTTAVAGNKAFFAGWEYSEFTNRVDIYDASTNTWSTASLSEARNGLSAIAAGNKVFFAGGYRKFDSIDDGPYDFSTRVDIYDIATNTWSTAELKEARSGMAVAAAGNKVFFAGGHYINDPMTGQGGMSKLVDVYDLSSNTWTTTTLSEPRNNIAAATAGSKILFAGGYGSSYSSSAVDIYDVSTNSWSTARLSQQRAVSSTATLGNKVLFFTGGDDDYRRMDIYDASANSWSAAELNKSLRSIAIAAGNQVFIGGGEVKAIGSSGSAFTNRVWKLQF